MGISSRSSYLSQSSTSTCPQHVSRVTRSGRTTFHATCDQMLSDEDDGSRAVSWTCARCQSPTKNRCTGCLGAPIYEQCVSKSTFYCSQVCQRADWRQHKSECKK